MKDIMGLMKKAKQMQENMEIAKLKVADLSVTGRSGGGLVTIDLAGGGNMTALKIAPHILVPEEVELLEDLIIAAYHDAKVQLDTASAKEMQDAMGDIEMPPGLM
jgi:DNA-binding YbaB/EbfC family protein